MNVITLTTDFGSANHAAGQINGIVWQIAPDARLVELTHQIPPGDLLTAQILLDYSVPYFPDGTVHLVLVGASGEDHRPIAARLGSQWFVGPDNGVITPLLERAEANRQTVEVFHANEPEYWLANQEPRVQWRQVLAPIAAHLARGVLITGIGDRINDPIRTSIPQPEVLENGWRGQVIQIDHFGNLAVNLKSFHLEGMGSVQVTINGVEIRGLARTFGDGQPGDLIALLDSSNRLSICVVNGSAASRLKVQVGTPVEVHPILEDQKD